jgi:hypothetical protein
MEFKRTEYKINVYGEQIVFRKPTGLEKKKWLVDLGEIADKAKDGEAYDYDEDYRITKKFLSSLGFPEKTFDSMEENHQIEVINTVIDIKKN